MERKNSHTIPEGQIARRDAMGNPVANEAYAKGVVREIELAPNIIYEINKILERVDF